MLAVLFFSIALFYASVGFGGGSSYIAILVLWKVPYSIIPAISLMCNIFVVLGSTFNNVKKNLLIWKNQCPLILFSMPMAYLGGTIHMSKHSLTLVLAVCLFICAIQLLYQHKKYNEISEYKGISFYKGSVMGSLLGFLSGITGIGGGIFLAPILYFLKVASPRHIAATVSFFILVNSAAGLIGQMQKHIPFEMLLNYVHLPFCAVLGGQLGNRAVLHGVPGYVVTLLTALLLLFVSVQMLATTCS